MQIAKKKLRLLIAKIQDVSVHTLNYTWVPPDQNMLHNFHDNMFNSLQLNTYKMYTSLKQKLRLQVGNVYNITISLKCIHNNEIIILQVTQIGVKQ